MIGTVGKMEKVRNQTNRFDDKIVDDDDDAQGLTSEIWQRQSIVTHLYSLYEIEWMNKESRQSSPNNKVEAVVVIKNNKEKLEVRNLVRMRKRKGILFSSRHDKWK